MFSRPAEQASYLGADQGLFLFPEQSGQAFRGLFFCFIGFRGVFFVTQVGDHASHHADFHIFCDFDFNTFLQESVEVEIAKDVKVSVMRSMIADLRDKKDAPKADKAKEEAPKGLAGLFGKKK